MENFGFYTRGLNPEPPAQQVSVLTTRPPSCLGFSVDSCLISLTLKLNQLISDATYTLWVNQMDNELACSLPNLILQVWTPHTYHIYLWALGAPYLKPKLILRDISHKMSFWGIFPHWYGLAWHHWLKSQKHMGKYIFNSKDQPKVASPFIR